MEEKSTLLRMISRQRDADGMSAEQTETYRARVSEEEGVTSLCYEIEGDPVTMRIREGAVDISREGALRMKLSIHSGKILPGIYVMPYGEMDISVRGKRVRITQERMRCEVRMEYDVLMGGQHAFSNDVRAVFRR